MGRVVSVAFLDEGATVVVTDQFPDELVALRRAAGANESRLEGHSVDVMNEQAVGQMIATIIAKHGRLDAMTNAVGGYAAGKKLWEADPKTLDRMLTLNLRSGYVLSRAAVPAMLKQGRGAIVNVASTAAFNHAAASA